MPHPSIAGLVELARGASTSAPVLAPGEDWIEVRPVDGASLYAVRQGRGVGHGIAVGPSIHKVFEDAGVYPGFSSMAELASLQACGPEDTSDPLFPAGTWPFVLDLISGGVLDPVHVWWLEPQFRAVLGEPDRSHVYARAFSLERTTGSAPRTTPLQTLRIGRRHIRKHWQQCATLPPTAIPLASDPVEMRGLIALRILQQDYQAIADQAYEELQSFLQPYAGESAGQELTTDIISALVELGTNYGPGEFRGHAAALAKAFPAELWKRQRLDRIAGSEARYLADEQHRQHWGTRAGTHFELTDLSPAEFAAYTGMNERTVYRKIDSGALEVIQRSPARISPTQIEHWSGWQRDREAKKELVEWVSTHRGRTKDAARMMVNRGLARGMTYAEIGLAAQMTGRVHRRVGPPPVMSGERRRPSEE